jgi:membrane fusion protein
MAKGQVRAVPKGDMPAQQVFVQQIFGLRSERAGSRRATRPLPPIHRSEARPPAGIVARPGAMVRAGEPLLTITPSTGELVAHLFAPSEAIGFVRAGAHVRVRYRAYPYQRFGQYPGTVVAITRPPPGRASGSRLP